MRISFYTLGCKVNQYETQILMQRFGQEGFDIVGNSDEADVYVVNSCTVTAVGDKKTRQIVRRFKRQNPQAVVALTGCMPQAFPEEASVLEDVQVVTGANNRAGLVNAVKHALATGERVVDITNHTRGESFEEMRVKGYTGRTRAFVKIQDGCERYCAYCIIPTARGSFRSKPLADVVQEVAGLGEEGFAEVVLVGINLSCYGVDLGLGLIDAVEAVCGVEGIRRVRLGSLEPELLSREHIRRLAALPQFCPQFHLSLQSGCDATLRRMNRHYTTAQYLEIVENIRQEIPDAAITTDIMAGFPGETGEEFGQTLEFVRRLGLAKAHVFAYSRRKGTRADTMTDQVPQGEKVSRSQRLLQVTDETRKRFLADQVGKSVSVLLETEENGIYYGYSENYTPVEIREGAGLCLGRLYRVKLTDVAGDVCTGEVIH